MRHLSKPKFRPLCALTATPLACRLLRWALYPAGSFRAALGVRLRRLRAISVVRLASLSALASLALTAVLFAIPAEQARAHDIETATHHAAAFPLHDAVRAGDLDFVNHFIAEHQDDAKADVNRASGSGVTPLHWAADGGDVAIAAALLAAGADVSLTTGSGQTPLHWAANGGHAAVVATLLAAGAEVDAKSDDGGTPLRFAAGGGHVSAVAELLAGGAEVDAKNDDGETPLHWAARNGRAAVVVDAACGGRGGECEKRRRRDAAALCRRRRSFRGCRRADCGGGTLGGGLRGSGSRQFGGFLPALRQCGSLRGIGSVLRRGAFHLRPDCGVRFVGGFVCGCE